MRERPILMSAPMVRSILAGIKSQTRRAMKPQPEPWEANPAILQWRDDHFFPGLPKHRAMCPYGVPGDRLWVRETWAKTPPCVSMKPNVAYRADYHPPLSDFPPGGALPDGERRWRPSIHMPRWASRIVLEITDVRVERLQEISEADCVAEGTPCYVCGKHMDGRGEDDCHCFHMKAQPSDYRALWESINGAGSWDANPFVWVIVFRRIGL